VRRLIRGAALVAGAVAVGLIGWPGIAYADNCGSLSDCYFTARSALAALVGLSVLFGVLLSIMLDFLPGIGTAKGIVEAVTGEDLVTGQELEWWERVLGVLPVLGGLVGAIAAVSKVANAADAASDLARGADRAGDAADAASDAARGTDRASDTARGAEGAEDAARAGRSEDVWAKQENVRGREIQDNLAQTDYDGYIETDSLDGFQRSKNFPLVDFVSPDGTHSVSVKTYNPFAKSYASGDTIYDIVAHADELADFAPGNRVTLDVRVPPGTPQQVIDDLIDTVRSQVDNPRFEIVVNTYP
jgi:hypothetical protein